MTDQPTRAQAVRPLIILAAGLVGYAGARSGSP